MNDLIWRSDAIKAITDEPTDAHYPSWYVDKLKGVPSAQPKKGSWEHCEDEDGMYDVCSNCGADVDISHYGQSYCYCPHCGAEMEVTE